MSNLSVFDEVVESLDLAGIITLGNLPGPQYTILFCFLKMSLQIHMQMHVQVNTMNRKRTGIITAGTTAIKSSRVQGYSLCI